MAGWDTKLKNLGGINQKNDSQPTVLLIFYHISLLLATYFGNEIKNISLLWQGISCKWDYLAVKLTGMMPQWDCLHPGRAWAERLQPCANTAEQLEERVVKYLLDSLSGH